MKVWWQRSKEFLPLFHRNTKRLTARFLASKPKCLLARGLRRSKQRIFNEFFHGFHSRQLSGARMARARPLPEYESKRVRHMLTKGIHYISTLDICLSISSSLRRSLVSFAMRWLNLPLLRSATPRSRCQKPENVEVKRGREEKAPSKTRSE